MSLPNSHGGINLCSASLHTPATCLASAYSSRALVELMYDVNWVLLNSLTPSWLPYLLPWPDLIAWQVVGDIDEPLKQHALSVTIDEALHQHLLSPATSTRARTLAFSSALPHAGD